MELEIIVKGNYEHQELKDFIEFQLLGGGISEDNAFIREDDGAEITRVDVY